ncbi:chemotaxis protein CheW [Undibacter mobilis]|uniref:Chemotaxis protein CheW n=1 Tax=Undibacter mobilis TaxID=2292256 RepID=A0A371BCT4_9BRAD|nr:chemotaxis protein CheW [Undibacter mobilis]RDV05370.1 chemotaxis protein CheW [Undibacter mobilis]
MSQVVAPTPIITQPKISINTTNDSESAVNGTAASHVTEFISFAIGEEQYGVDIMAVREIKGWSDITHLPKQPDYVRGVLNLRGAIVPIVDLRCRFGQGLTETTPLHIVIIVQIGDRQVGLIGDRVLDIVSVTPAQIQQVPRTSHAHSTSFLAGLVSNEDVMIALIDLPHLLADHVANEQKTVVLDA